MGYIFRKICITFWIQKKNPKFSLTTLMEVCTLQVIFRLFFKNSFSVTIFVYASPWRKLSQTKNIFLTVIFLSINKLKVYFDIKFCRTYVIIFV